MLLNVNKKIWFLFSFVFLTFNVKSFVEYFLLESNSHQKLLIISDAHRRQLAIRETGRKLFEGIFTDIESKDYEKIKFLYEVSNSYFLTVKEKSVNFLLADDPRGVDLVLKLFLDYHIKYENSKDFPIDFGVYDPRVSDFLILVGYFYNLNKLINDLQQKGIIDFKNSAEFLQFKNKYLSSQNPTLSEYLALLNSYYKQFKDILEKSKDYPLYSLLISDFNGYVHKIKQFKKYAQDNFRTIPNFSKNLSLQSIMTATLEDLQTTQQLVERHKFYYDLIASPVNAYIVNMKYFISILGDFGKGYKNIGVYIGLNHARYLVNKFTEFGFKIIEHKTSPYFNPVQLTVVTQNIDQKLLDAYFEELKKTFYQLLEKKDKMEIESGKSEVE